MTLPTLPAGDLLMIVSGLAKGGSVAHVARRTARFAAAAAPTEAVPAWWFV